MERMGGMGAILSDELARAHRAGEAGMSVVLVEGVSDRRAVEAVATHQGRNLRSEGVAVIPIAGATNIGRFLDLLGPDGYDVLLTGLCDEDEQAGFEVALETAGMGRELDAHGMEQIGFFVCRADLEDELVRALGPEIMQGLIRSQGQLRRFRSFQNQPAQRHKTIEQQLRRWLGNHKIRYAPLMVSALEPDRIPAPLIGLLDFL